jgi:dienelactone hydrolase
MAGRQLDTLVFTHDLYEHTKRAWEFKATTPVEAQAWQDRVRAGLVRLYGGFPKDKCALEPEVLSTAHFPGYTRHTVLFQSRVNLTVFAYLLIPDGYAAPGPAVICLPGHGRGADDIVGIGDDGAMRTVYGGYQNDFALQCVHNGMAALAVEQLGFGHRRDEAARERGGGDSSCQPAAGAALLLGQTMVGWRVWDVIRAVDYLETRVEIDPQRIACCGISGGGTITFFTACVEPRLKAAYTSGYYNTFRDSILSLAHCIDNYVPGLLRYAEMYDLVGLIAPRLFFVESGTQDSIFPVEATRYAVSKAREVYRVFGAQEQLGVDIFQGEHAFHGVKGIQFLKERL